MTGYQETLTDPSFAGQIITFTFPHIGNVGTTAEDEEAINVAARGLVVKQDLTEPSNWRASQTLDAWLRQRGIPGISGGRHAGRSRCASESMVRRPACCPIRQDRAVRHRRPARSRHAPGPGLEGMDLAREVSCTQSYEWTQGVWNWGGGDRRRPRPGRAASWRSTTAPSATYCVAW